MGRIPLLAKQPVAFPDPRYAAQHPDGLLAAGGALTTEWLLEAYRNGIFPWFESDEDHILWWSPAQRAVLRPGEMRIPRSLAKRIRNGGFSISSDQNFQAVVDGCRQPRSQQQGTWITDKMCHAYVTLHEQGHAHSVEVWHDGRLVGGLYGVSVGRVFCGESMFSTERDASKIAFYHLQNHLEQLKYTLIDCQMMNPHLQNLGVGEMSKMEFLDILETNRLMPTNKDTWDIANGQNRDQS